MTETIPLEPNKVYQIYNHANGSDNLFRSNENYRYFLQKYGEYIFPFADTYAYCLLPNHFHFMVKIRTENEIIEALKIRKKEFQTNFENFQDLEKFGFICGKISQQFSNFFNAYSKAFNNMYNRKGNLFIQKIRRKPIENTKYFEQLVAYIHLNPIKHGFCKNIMDWEHSSIHAYYSDKHSKVNGEILADWLQNKSGLIKFHETIKINEKEFEF